MIIRTTMELIKQIYRCPFMWRIAMKDELTRKIKENEQYAVDIRGYLHKHPELSGEEYETSAFIKSELDKIGIPYISVGTTSILATIQGEKPGKCIALRADMDALPIQETIDWDIKSEKPGVMHACGHDAHSTMLLTAGKILWELRDKICGTVKLFFQEAEEKGGGAHFFVDGHYLDDVDNVMALHVYPAEEVGYYSIGYGYRTATGGNVDITINGKGGHSSKPYQTINPVIVASEIVNAINQRVAYGFDTFDTVTLTPTVIMTGTKSNIIPEEAKITYNARFYDTKYHEIIEQMTTQTAKGIAEAYGAKVEVRYRGFASGSVYNDEKCVDRCLKVMEELHGKECIHITPGAMFGEDFARMTSIKPGLMVMVGSLKPSTEYVPLHNEKTRIDNGALTYGISLLAGYTLKFLNE